MWYTVDIYDKTWKIVSNLKLNDEIFSDDKINHNLIHEYYLLQTSNARNPIAHTKTRWEVAGSGKNFTDKKVLGMLEYEIEDRLLELVGCGILT